MPTIFDVCGVKGPRTLGRSWLPLMKGARTSNWDYVFTSRNNWGYPGASRATVTGKRWSYVVAEPEHPGMLFDLRADPGQKRNVIRSHPGVANKMHRAFMQFMHQSDAAEGYINKYVV